MMIPNINVSPVLINSWNESDLIPLVRIAYIDIQVASANLRYPWSIDRITALNIS